jgi:enterochelin esterase-like enzyme
MHSTKTIRIFTALLLGLLAGGSLTFGQAGAPPAPPANNPPPAATTPPVPANPAPAAPRRGGRGGGGPPMTDAEKADVAKLAELPSLTPQSGDGDYKVGPMYANDPALRPLADGPKGKVYEFEMTAADSKFYPGNGPRGATATRKVAVYVPAGYTAGTPAPCIVAQDGYLLNYNKLLPPILDHLIAAHRLPAMVAVMIQSGGGDGPGSERGLEYDTVSGKYAEFIEAEALPRIARDYNITFTKDPDGRMTLGGSSGGSAALAMAWFHPELYHRVLTYSGTYVNNQSPVNPALPHGAWEFHEHLIPQNDAKPLRLWIEAGENDNGSTRSGASMGNWILANMHMAAVLKAKGYHYQFVYALGGRHVDSRVVGQTLPQALEWVWQDYKPVTK